MIKRVLCLIIVLCAISSLSTYTVCATEGMYNFNDYIDVPLSFDLNCDGKTDTLTLDSYTNYFARYLFNINDVPFIFEATRHGYYDAVKIVDIDETDKFLDIVVIGVYKGAWAEVYRYDGNKLYECVDAITFSDEREYDVLEGYIENIQIDAGDGKLVIKCGGKTQTFEISDFIEVELYSENLIMEEAPFNCYDVEIDGKIIELNQYPVNKNNRILMPVRSIFEELGYSIQWDQETKTVHASKGNDSIIIQIGNKTIIYTVDGVSGEYICDIAPQIIGNRTLVPLRGVAESAGCIVDWIEETSTARITTRK